MPSLSILVYCTWLINCTFLFFKLVRCIQPVVLPRPPPNLPLLRLNMKISLGDSGILASTPSMPLRASKVLSIPHSFSQASIFKEVLSPSCDKYSDTSKPIPPAPITATRLPTGFFNFKTSI